MTESTPHELEDVIYALEQENTELKGRIQELEASFRYTEPGGMENGSRPDDFSKSRSFNILTASRTAHMASLGELVAGVAHEINNPINIIMNYAELVKDDASLGNTDLLLDYGNEIIGECRRIIALVNPLLSYAKPSRVDRESIAFMDLLTESLVLVQTQMQKEGIQIKIESPSNLPPLWVCRHEIQQVFVNLIQNARHALNTRFSGSDPEKRLSVYAESIDEGRFLRIRFHDRGVGIAEADRKRIFEPFFTSKGTQGGAGLGLSICRKVVLEHGGGIDVESRLGEFTEFKLRLPADQGE